MVPDLVSEDMRSVGGHAKGNEACDLEGWRFSVGSDCEWFLLVLILEWRFVVVCDPIRDDKLI